MGLALAFALVGYGSAAAAQDPATAREAVERLDRSLKEVVRLLEALLENQKGQLLVRRISLMEDRLAPLGEEIRRTDRAILDRGQEVQGLERMLADLEDEISDATLRNLEPPENEMRMKEELERALENQRGQVETLERRKLELESELARGRREIEILDDQLSEFLESAGRPR